MYADQVREGELRELAAWEKFDVYARRNACNASREIAQIRWVLTWKTVDGEKCVKARLAARGFQDPDLREGLVDTSCCISLRSSHSQVISLNAINMETLEPAHKECVLASGRIGSSRFASCSC